MTNKQIMEINKRLQTLIIKIHPNIRKYRDFELKKAILREFYLCIKNNYKDNYRELRKGLKIITSYLKIAKALGYTSNEFFYEIDLELSKIKALTVNA